jgi:hypothetical protein
MQLTENYKLFDAATSFKLSVLGCSLKVKNTKIQKRIYNIQLLTAFLAISKQFMIVQRAWNVYID